MNSHHLSVNQIIDQLNSSSKGLSHRQAQIRLAQNGPNEMVDSKKKSILQLFLNQFKDFMILILLLAAVVSGYLGDFADTIIIVVIIILNAAIGFYQEFKAEKAMSAIKKLSSFQVLVEREGDIKILPSKYLVTGDVLLLETGNFVPADIRLLESHLLKVDESTLTGESISIVKNPDILLDENCHIGERINMVYKGTYITYGRGKGIVTATGSQTELGKIALMLKMEETKTPLQIRMLEFSKKLSYIIIGLCIAIFTVGVLRGENTLNMLLLTISLAVAAIPEALPALITIALALGSARMSKKNALIRKLNAVETLGSVSFICTDKTGTLTQNKMEVNRIKPSKNSDRDYLQLLHISMALNNDTIYQNEEYLGDPTETALVAYISKVDSKEFYLNCRNLYPRVAEVPFDSDRKCMTTVHKYGDHYLIVTKGALENIGLKLKKGEEQKGLLEGNTWAVAGIRVLAFAYKLVDNLPNDINSDTLENELCYLGAVGMVDPPREEVKLAINECLSAGIKPVMITGDHQQTAIHIAKEIGIWTEKSICKTGKELQLMNKMELSANLENISVFARVSPEQKLQIISAFQSREFFIAMTGDGVNDAPALKAANIGIAMGMTGTDVSKEASDMILLDDNFATIVMAIKEGRRIYDNIRKFIKYIMTCNSAEIWTIALAPLFGLPIPLLPIHILWINLVTDGLPGLALASERPEPDLMRRPPRAAKESLFADGVGYHILWVGLLMAGITIAVQYWSIYSGLQHWQTMVFTVLSFSQLGHVMAIRSERTFLYKQGFNTNKPLLISVLLTVALQLVVIYLPFANQLLKTQPLSFLELGLCFLMSAIVFHAVEAEKWWRQRKGKTNM